MIGISYFAMTQLEAAVERPPHLKAIFPVAVTADLYEAVSHHGLFSSSFITPFLSVLGMTSKLSDDFLRSALIDAVRTVLHVPAVHRKFATMNGEASITALKLLMKLHHDPHPWDDYWRTIAVERPLRDAWWEERNLMPLLEQVEVPVYLGCDWQNVPLHLPSTFPAFKALTGQPACARRHARRLRPDLAVGEPARRGAGLVRPLAEGQGHRHSRRAAHPLRPCRAPMAGANRRYLADPGDGVSRIRAARRWRSRAPTKATSGTRAMMTLGAGLNRDHASETDPPAFLTWTSAPLDTDLDMVGESNWRSMRLAPPGHRLASRRCRMSIPSGTVTDVTAGYLRASLRAVDEAASRPGAPVLPCRTFEAVPIGELSVTAFRWW